MLLNLSPQWYNAYRVAGFTAAAKRAVFMQPIHDAGIKRWVEIKNAGDQEFGYEITYWTREGRTILFVVMEPEIHVTSEGGGNAVGLKTATCPITLHFAAPIKDAKDERTGKALGRRRFHVRLEDERSRRRVVRRRPAKEALEPILISVGRGGKPARSKRRKRSVKNFDHSVRQVRPAAAIPAAPPCREYLNSALSSSGKSYAATGSAGAVDKPGISTQTVVA